MRVCDGGQLYSVTPSLLNDYSVLLSVFSNHNDYLMTVSVETTAAESPTVFTETCSPTKFDHIQTTSSESEVYLEILTTCSNTLLLPLNAVTAVIKCISL